jgi:phage-related baseplate assembly protein
MSRFVAIDLDKLPPPNVVEALSFEAILAEMKADYAARYPAFSADLESEPMVKLLEVAAYRELNVRQRVNDAARAVLLATSKGADLDNIGAFYNVERLVVTPADPDALPPVAAVLEADDRFRRRIQLSLEGFSTAGPEGAYIFHTLTASAAVKDVAVESPTPSAITVTILSTTGNGTASDELKAAVATALAVEDTVPLGDRVTVVGAEVVEYVIDAKLILYPGPDAAVVEAAALAGGQDMTAKRHRIGEGVPDSAIKAALHAAGVKEVIVNEPAGGAGVPVTAGQAAYCTAINLTVEVAGA